jgi:hypothetical protein
MSSQASDLAVRRYERYLCDLPAMVDIAPSSAGAVCLGQAAVGTNGRVSARVTDCSAGGLGLKSPVYFPHTANLRVTITLPAPLSGSLDVCLRVQRVAMTDRKPTYYVGGAFEGLSGDHLSTVQALMEALKASGAQLMPEKSRA